MEKIKEKKNKIVFSVDTNETIINSIRRYVNQIKVLAIDEVEISNNGSALYDETIAHRLGLIPLINDKNYSKKTPTFELAEDKQGVVYSKDIKGDIKIIDGNFPITSLNKGQEIKLKGTTNLGKGIEHAKYNPGLIYYRNISEIIVDKKVAEKLKEIIPNLEIKEKGEKAIIIDNQEKEAIDLFEGASIKMQKEYEIKEKPGLIVTVESFGQFETKDLFLKAVQVLKEDLEELDKKL
jgi:DNA-directed RNA polymerase subunit D